MEKGKYVKDILPNTEVTGLFATVDPSLNQAKNGPFWKLGLADVTGMIEAKIWFPLSMEIGELNAGLIVYIDGRASMFRDALQITVDRYAPLSQEEMASVNIDDFVQSTPYDREEMFQRLHRACMEEFTHAPWRKLVSSILKNPEIRKNLCLSPAAKTMHHAYAGGLLEHTLGVFTLCRSLCDLYPELDRQTLLAGALFHDLGKIREFSGGIANDYTDEGRLVGHILLGLEILEPFLSKSGLERSLQDHLKHLILSHHGQHEFGAPCLPQTREAFILHYADNMDAKMGQFRKLFEEMGNTESQWSPWQQSLGRKIFRPARTPLSHEGHIIPGGSAQCLSLWKA